jgi:hypothetical protein
LPPASDDELAALVQTQVLGEAGTGGENIVVDFVPQSSDAETERMVEVVLADRRVVNAYNALASAAGVRLRRLVLRPYATASLLQTTQGEGTVLLVNALGGEVDLIIASADCVFLWRTVQLAAEGGAPPSAAALSAEIARTLAVAPAHMADGDAVEKVLLLGNDDQPSDLTLALSDQIGIPVETMDAASAASVSGGDALAASGAAAPAIAMLLEEARSTAPAVDLLSPRKPPKPPSHKRTAALATIAAAVALFIGWSWISDLHAEARRENLSLYTDYKKLRKDEKELASQVAVARSIAAWEASSVVWLDELRDLSMKFPATQDLVVRAMTINPIRNGGALIRLSGQAREWSVVVQMDSDLRDPPYRDAASSNYREQSAGRDSTSGLRFETQIKTRQRSAEAYRQGLAAYLSSLVPTPPSSRWSPIPIPAQATRTLGAAGSLGQFWDQLFVTHPSTQATSAPVAASPSPP